MSVMVSSRQWTADLPVTGVSHQGLQML
jgi:hypothetical protein